VVGVRAGEVLDGMPRRREAEARRLQEWIGPARSRSHGAGVVLVVVVHVEEERADAAEACCGEWDGMEAQASLAHQPRRGGACQARRGSAGTKLTAAGPTRGEVHRARRGGVGAELTAVGSGLASAGSKLGKQAPSAQEEAPV